MASSRLNKACCLSDFYDNRRADVIRLLEPESCRAWPGYPAGREHRRLWEYAQLLTGFQSLNALTPDSLVLGVGTGVDKALFELTRRAKLVFAADTYAGSPSAAMLTDPERFGADRFDRHRLIVQHMQPWDLRFEEGTFDAVYSFGISGGLAAAGARVAELARVVKMGGTVMISVEFAVAGTQADCAPLRRDDVQVMVTHQPGLELVEPVDWTVDAETLSGAQSMERVMEDLARGHTEYPHLVLQQDGCRFTSLSLFLRKKRPDA